MWCPSRGFFLFTEFLCLEIAYRIIVIHYVNFWQLNSQDLTVWRVAMGKYKSIFVCLGYICINKINRSRSVGWISSCWKTDRYTAFQRVLIGLIWMAISTCRAFGALFSHLFRQNWAEKIYDARPFWRKSQHCTLLLQTHVPGQKVWEVARRPAPVVVSWPRAVQTIHSMSWSLWYFPV